MNNAYQILQFKLKTSTDTQCKLPVLKLTAYYTFLMTVQSFTDNTTFFPFKALTLPLRHLLNQNCGSLVLTILPNTKYSG